jgi:hypothetical protein
MLRVRAADGHGWTIRRSLRVVPPRWRRLGDGRVDPLDVSNATATPDGAAASCRKRDLFPRGHGGGLSLGMAGRDTEFVAKV